MSESSLHRCSWCGSDELYVRYHDEEWGVPVHDERRLFEMLTLEGAQAGLSWLTVLRKRENYREAFDEFDPERIARYTDKRIAALLENPGIIRNRLKVHSTVRNARALLELREAGLSFPALLWSFTGGTTQQNSFSMLSELPARTPESDAMSKELKRRGFTFVGPTICYAFMQAVGMVNDHVVDCFRHHEIADARMLLNSKANARG
jgi:DNA-3-methyladenine glycosylase I